MKNVLLIIIALLLALFCACQVPEPFVGPMPSGEEQSSEGVMYETEPQIFTIGGTDYELSVPAKTRINDYAEGNIEILTSSLTEPGTVIDLSGLSGCEYIDTLVIKLNGESENLIIPNLPSLSYCEIYGNSPTSIDISAMESYNTLSLAEIIPEKIDIGAGPENIVLAEGFDIAKLAGAGNVKSVTVHGNADLSKIADMGEVEKVYIFGKNDNVAELQNLGSLKRLSFQSFEGDLSGIGKLSMETLVFNSDITQETLDTLAKSETVKELHLNDEFITNADFMEKLPNLETMILSVNSSSSLEGIDEEQLEALETNIPKEPLKEFIRKGGIIYLNYDWGRT